MGYKDNDSPNGFQFANGDKDLVVIKTDLLFVPSSNEDGFVARFSICTKGFD